MTTTTFLTTLAQTRRFLAAGIIALTSLPAFAITFTNNTSIGPANSNYDGATIIITNCTVTVDGVHSFTSLRVAAGGVLTHSFSPSGVASNIYYVTNEPQTLNGTFPVVLNSNVITASVFVTDTTGTIPYTNGQDYLLTSPDGILTDLQRTTNSSIPNGATVLVSYEGFGASGGTVPEGLFLSITGNVEVDAGGAINVNGAGYSVGPGAGLGYATGGGPNGGGGGYGGNGANGGGSALGGTPYGSFLQPTNLGSGGGQGNVGGYGGAGGGLIQIAAGGIVTVNGLITANGAIGTNDFAGGGSGGGIWITGLSLAGTGTISANGGAGDPASGGGGGGGRIALQYNSTTFTGSMTAYGSMGGSSGSAGTFYTQVNGQNGLLVLDNGGRLSATNTALTVSSTNVNVLIRSNASVQPVNFLTCANLTVASNGLVTAFPATTMYLYAAGAITVEVGGSILANNGAASGTGTGAGRSYNDGLYRPCGGGSFGGSGAAGSNTNATSGETYGSQMYNGVLGSGGGTLAPYSYGGSGGGGIQITSGIVQVDGIISANGGNGSGSGGGGGSGGGIYFQGGTLFGSGAISANGGTGANSQGGGGGGGRVYLAGMTNLFAGAISAYGGGGANWGGAGTVYLQAPGQNTQLILDNGGNLGTNTVVQSASADLIVRGGAIGSASGSVSFANLYVNSNGWLAPVLIQNDAILTFSISGNATIQPGGGIIADFGGYAPGEGTGAGRIFTSGSTTFCSGAGHGGYGGNSYGNYATGGGTYDLPTGPTVAGSGGGSAQIQSLGGAGGGVIRLTVTGTLEVDGIISANGGSGSGLAGGGGSGGSIWLAVGTLTGGGSIAANGGSGAENLGGGGAGGMIYIPANNNSFSGTITAYGGGGANRGGVGTTIIQLPGKNPQLVLDAGGNPGAYTPLPNSSSIDVTLRNGAVGYVAGTLTTGNMLISSNASLVVTNLSLSCLSLTIQAGGLITGDSQGLLPGLGNAGNSSANSNYPCGGGGNGGSGGNSYGNLAAGGGATSSPDIIGGGGGGNYSPYSLGGSGGGEIAISTSGLMQIDGIISANGGNGSGLGGGGGAGGTISLSAGTFAGAGIVRANGGSGAGSIGGGGGGGWVTITMTFASQFNGIITAYGGGGANSGGAGPVSTQTSGQAARIVLDNGGNQGVPTALPNSNLAGVTLRNGAVGLFNGPSGSSLGNVLVTSNASLLMSNSGGYGINCSNLTVQAGGGIIADFLGSAGGSGNEPGHSYSSSNYPCGGGGNGGPGGNSVGNLAAGGGVYLYAQSGGSGGGTFSPYSPGGAGGGVISINTSGLMQIDGIISANGGNGAGLGGGGGAGGNISLTAGTLAGAGVIRANGGSGVISVGGGGGGGVVTLTVTSSGNANQFIGTISAYGGGGANWGGAGLVTMQATGQAAQLVLDDGGNPGPPTPLSGFGSTNLTVRNGASAYVNGSLTLGNLLIGPNGSLLVSNNTSYTVTCSNLTVQAGGSIIADSLGYAGGLGEEPGHGYEGATNYPCGGGGNGGAGGNSFGNLATGGGAYTFQPSAGSSGGAYPTFSYGGPGGGVISITATGLMQIDGIISANGGNGSGLGGGGGAGGSIKLTAGTLAGGGSIRANGGSGVDSTGGGGGGGWISITLTSTANQFGGTITAYGGGGANWGGAGPVSLQTNGPNIQLTYDNGGNPGTPSALFGSISTNVTLRNGAVGLVSGSLSLGNLLISSNASLLVSNGESGILMTFSSATIQAGGGIIADSQGFAAGQGNGLGHASESSPNYPCSGAGHGGTGGSSLTNAIAGGVPYDNQSSPNESGSGGGTFSPYSLGGAGGGAFLLNVSGLLQNDGIISANGGNGSGIGGGGGSGGSIKLTAGTLSGAGSIRANGGSGAGSIGGGGAGGCIALFPTSNLFTGTISVAGGGGANWGGAGTIYTQTSGQSAQLIFDNAGQAGAPTPIQSVSSTTALILRNGAVAYPQSTPETFASLLISSNSFLKANTNTGLMTLTLTGNATIQAGAGIVTDGQGSPAGSGSGAGHSGGGSPYFPCGGGGYGGFGANSLSNLAGGGVVYASITAPVNGGSGGGNFAPYSPGGAGGGAIHLAVTGTLDASGRISANGGNGSGLGGGGGAGGSVYLTVGTLVGNGSITANGGSGADAVGGGGGGGRISISYTANDYVGTMAAQGGGGSAYGGAGTIYTTASGKTSGQVLVDNGGIAGADTPLSGSLGSPSFPFNLTVQNGAVVCPQTNVIFPQLNSLTVNSGGTLTGLPGLSTLDVLVSSNVDIASGGVVSVDGEGYPQATGPGTGVSAGGYGSGAGYGGMGGASASSPGGLAYGSALQPTDFGSGGGVGSGTFAGGSAGGGAMRLNVGGIFTLSGLLSAGGQPGLQNNSGGGSGGSIWVTAGNIAGSGSIAANGGAGELYDGGGGAGGRIALYSLANAFIGSESASGGGGDFLGGNGTIVISNNVSPLQVLSNSPGGVVSNTVSSVVLYFNGAPNPNSINAGSVSVTTPNGPLSSNSISIVMLSSASYQVNFPQQTTIGNYTVTVAQNVTDLYGRALAQVYNGTFSISLPTIQGYVMDAYGNPIPGVLVQPTAGSSATTDTNGFYTLGFVPGSSITVTPSLGALIFVPPSMSYTNISASVSNQNYTGAPTLAPVLTGSTSATNFVLSWQSIAGVTYQVYSSPDLTNWAPYGAPFPGGYGPIQFPIPLGTNSQQFFSVQPGD